MSSANRFRRRASLCLVTSLLFVVVYGNSRAWGQSAIAPRPLIDVSSPDAARQVRENGGNPTIAVDRTGISVTLPGAPASFPGIQVIPASGKSWDLTPFGHVEARVTNTGGKAIRIIMRVDGFAQGGPATNAEALGIKPGESKLVKVIFGYQWGFKPTALVEASKITEVLLFVGKSAEPQSFRVEDLQGAGAAGEKPPFNPDDVVTKPAGGMILGSGIAFDPVKQVIARGVTVSAGADGALAVNLPAGNDKSLTIKPAMGTWDLTAGNEIKVKFKNVGSSAVTPSVVVGPNTVASSEPIAPGAEAEIAVSFAPKVTPILPSEPVTKTNAKPKEGTGTTFESNKAKGFEVLFDSGGDPRNLLITSVIADAPVDEIPDWLGKKPPVDGEWTQTFDEEFDGPTLDYKKWNIYGPNFWDQRTHFSKEDDILKDGTMILRYEKKSGPHNDNPSDPQNDHRTTDYSCGYLNTFGKFTQRYGYFESRMKLPAAPGLWPAFWLMPDRGKALGAQSRRASTSKYKTDTGIGGMEFDIMEFLSGWGPYRYNIACHWDGYGKDHKAIGSEHTYVRTDKDKYITSGLLWTPGSAVFYNNGREVLRWENPRVSDVQEYLMFDMVSGGWDNTQLDDSKLPSDLTIDYVRVWQRKGLASPEDGPKPNEGDPDERKN